MDRGDKLLLWIMGFVIVMGVAIVLIFGEKPVNEPEPTLAPYSFIVPDWEICWDDCCVTQADFEGLCKERVEERE